MGFYVLDGGSLVGLLGRVGVILEAASLDEGGVLRRGVAKTCFPLGGRGRAEISWRRWVVMVRGPVGSCGCEGV
eukprot:765343-Hanusia_phi.AAC.4